MKIITWNCRDKFNDKANYILARKPDILIVPECKKLEIQTFPGNIEKPNSVFWVGDANQKGLGVFSFSDFKLKAIDTYNAEFKHIIPLKINIGTRVILLLAVWTHPPYVKQLLNAIDFYSDLIEKHETIIAGDFNSNSIWDYKNKTFSHSNIVKKLSDKSIFSTYHHFYNEKHGEETQMTHHHSSTKMLFHIDYCFTSKSILDSLENVVIGEMKYSDHSPLVMTFKL